MSGMEMMMKAMGFDPKAVMSYAEGFRGELEKFVKIAEKTQADVAEILATTRRIELAVDTLCGADGGPKNLRLPDDELLEKFGPKTEPAWQGDTTHGGDASPNLGDFSNGNGEHGNIHA